MLFEEILSLLGDFDRYQRRTYFLVCLMVVPAAWHVLAQVFIAAEVDHWCEVPALEPVNCSEWNLSQVECTQAKKDASIPKISTSSSGKVLYEQCQQYDLAGIDFYPGIETANITNATLGCEDGWVYDTSQYKSTVVMKFNLVCDVKNIDDYVQSVFFAGFLCGSFIFGSLADWIGRRRTLFICLAIQATMGLIVAFSPAFWFYTFFRFILAASTIGVYFISFVLGTEFVGPSKRILIGALVAMAFAVGYMILAILAVLIREWWVLQLVISLPIYLLIPLAFLLPESARWLMSRGNYKRAEGIIRNAAKVNGVKLPDNLFLEEISAFEELESTHPTEIRHRTSFLDLFRTPNMRIKTINIMFNWFVNSLVYHGLSLSTSTLGSNDYVAFFVSGAVEIPSYILMIFVAERWGRRPSMCTFMIIGGFACLISTFLPTGAPRLVVAMIGKFCVALSFALIYIFSAELFPTPVRSIGIGISNVAGFTGAIFTPIVLTLADVWGPLPYFLFGLLEIIAGAFAIMLPETLGEKLPDTLEEGEIFGKNRIRSLTGSLIYHTSRRGRANRPSSLWMQSPTYEKVVENADTNKDEDQNQNKKGTDSLWIAKPAANMEGLGTYHDNPQDQTVQDTEEGLPKIDLDDEQDSDEEINTVDLSTCREPKDETTTKSTPPSKPSTDGVGELNLPSEDLTTPGEDKTTLSEDITTPSEDINPPSEDMASEDINPLSEDITPPNEDINPPSEDTTPPNEDINPPSEDINPTGEEINPPKEEINSTAEVLQDGKSDTPDNEEQSTDKLLDENNDQLPSKDEGDAATAE